MKNSARSLIKFLQLILSSILSHARYLQSCMMKSIFVRNVLLIISGTALAQIIALAFSPVITRLYGPEAFGLLGTFMALVTVISPIAAFTYPIAIVLPKKDHVARGITRLSIYVSMSIAAFVGLFIVMAGDWLAITLQVQDISSYLILLPLVIVASAWLQVNKQWLIRKQNFKIMAKVTVFHAIIVNVTKSGVGAFKPLGAVLILISALGIALHAVMLFVSMQKKTGKSQESLQKTQESPRNIQEELISVNPISLKDLAKKYIEFPLFQTPQVFLNAISQSLPVLMLAAIFGPAIAGFYTLSNTILKMPSHLIGKALGDVFYPKIAEAANRGENLTRLLVTSTLALLAVGFVPFATIAVLGPWLFGFIFGHEWVIAGEYARWLAIWLYFAFLNPPSAKAIIVYKKQHLAVILNIISLALRAGVILIAGLWFESALLAVAAYSLVGALHNIVFIAVTYFHSRGFNPIADTN